MNTIKNILDIDKIIEYKNEHKNEEFKKPYSPKTKLMNDAQIHELWIKLTEPEKNKHVHGNIPKTYDEFYKKIKESQNLFLSETQHDS